MNKIIWTIIIILAIVFVPLFLYLHNRAANDKCTREHGENFTSNTLGTGCRCADGFINTNPQKGIGQTSLGLGEVDTYECKSPMEICREWKHEVITKARYNKETGVLICDVLQK